MSARVLGAVLAGGASSRFGSDKAVAMLGGRTLLERAREALAPVCGEVVVVGRGEVPDRPSAGLGPLGGIAGALAHAAERSFASVLTIACDMPAVPDDLLAALLRRTPAYCPDAPVLGHWPAALAGGLIERLTAAAPPPGAHPGAGGCAGRRAAAPARSWMPGEGRHDGGDGKSGALSVRRWAESIGAVAIPAPAPLANVNTRADLAAL